MRYLPILLLVGSADAGPPATGVIEGSVKLKGKPLGPVVVYVEGDGPPAEITGDSVVAQRLKSFQPRGLVIPRGGTVAFPNEDTLFHNVFSDEPGNSFNLGVYGPGTSREQRFDQTGPVHVWCHRHEEMSMQVLVLPNKWFGTVENGVYRIEGVPPGDYELVSWSTEYDIVKTTVSVTAGQITKHDFAMTRERFLRRPGYEE